MREQNACFPRITGQSDVLSTLVGQNVMLVGKVVHVQDGVSVVQGCVRVASWAMLCPSCSPLSRADWGGCERGVES